MEINELGSFNDLVLYKCTFHDDWDYMSEIFRSHPHLRNNPLNERRETPLMLAVGTNRSHNFVKTLVSSLSSDHLIYDALFAQNDQGDTALHYAAKVQNLIDARLMLSSSTLNPEELIFKKNYKGKTPLEVAARHGNKNEMLEYLFSVIGISPTNVSLTNEHERRIDQLLGAAIEGEFIELALTLADRLYSTSVLFKGWKLQRELNKLARTPKLFRSGSKLGFLGRLIYSLLHVDRHAIAPILRDVEFQHRINTSGVLYIIKSTSERILRYIAPPIMNIFDMKVTHGQADILASLLSDHVMNKRDKEVAVTIFESTMLTAVRFGNFEVIENIMNACPSVVNTTFEGFDLFHEAIKQRQERIYNIVYQMTSYRVFIASHINEVTNENALHIVAKLAPSHRLATLNGGAALQMQHELQWFKEIESNFIEPSYIEEENIDGKTPRMVFTEEHANLLKEGQNWMKGTASSSTVVAALIVTVAFAAVFTVPGGNKNEGKNEGKPVYLDNGAFMLFIISDAVALFSSVTSVLMFLGILTSRFAEEDFLYTLPTRMTIGLTSLFLSLVAMMVAFSATLTLVLKDEIKWIAAPLVIITSIPVGVFGVLQFPLLIQLLYSTYGPSIFHKQSEVMLH